MSLPALTNLNVTLYQLPSLVDLDWMTTATYMSVICTSGIGVGCVTPTGLVQAPYMFAFLLRTCYAISMIPDQLFVPYTYTIEINV
jgi:hypothetical protein